MMRLISVMRRAAKAQMTTRQTANALARRRPNLTNGASTGAISTTASATPDRIATTDAVEKKPPLVMESIVPKTSGPLDPACLWVKCRKSDVPVSLAYEGAGLKDLHVAVDARRREPAPPFVQKSRDFGSQRCPKVTAAPGVARGRFRWRKVRDRWLLAACPVREMRDANAEEEVDVGLGCGPRGCGVAGRLRKGFR